MPTILSRKGGGSGGSGAGVSSFSESGQPALTGAVTLSEGTGVTLTQVGQDISIAASMVLIFDSLLGADAASFDVTDIPGTYKHLKGYLQVRGTEAVPTQQAFLRYNNDSGANYSWVNTNSGSGGGLTAGRLGLTTGSIAVADCPSTHEFFIADYAGSVFIKYGLVMAGFINPGVTSLCEAINHHWAAAPAAVTRLTVFPNAGNWLAGSRFTLYGLN